jgi:hypothetical protein
MTPSVRDRLANRINNVRFRCRVPLERAGLRHGVLPDFLVIGAMKAGTTMFYEWLVTHPNVLPAAVKEVHFFDSHFPEAQPWYRAHLPTARQYRRRAKRLGGRVVTGEASPTYLFHPLAPRRVRWVVPQVKLIVLLRDPVNRAYSHYQTGIRHDWEALSFEAALDREEQRLDGQIDALLMDERHHRSFPRYRWSYQAMGRYAEQLEAWFAHFPREQFLFVDNKDFDRDPDAVYRRVYDFLDIPYHPLPEKKRRVVGRYDPMDPKTRQRLEQYFAPHNRRLADLLDLELEWDSQAP